VGTIKRLAHPDSKAYPPAVLRDERGTEAHSPVGHRTTRQPSPAFRNRTLLVIGSEA